MYLSWDSAGDDIAAGPTQTAVNLTALQTSGRKAAVISLDNMRPRSPGDQTTPGTLYLWVKLDAVAGSPPSLIRARLHWRLPSTRGG